MDADGNVTDLFGGRDDLARRCIRCVGDPEKRFREDALRMLRAYRFSAQLGFALDQIFLPILQILLELVQTIQLA